jgi:hypothetical protein
MLHADCARDSRQLLTILGRALFLWIVWMATMPGCATKTFDPGTKTFDLVDALPLQTGQFDTRGLRIFVTTYERKGKLSSTLSGWGHVQSIGTSPIDVYGLQFNLDGQVLSLSARLDLGGTGRFAGPRGELSFDEAFKWYPQGSEVAQIVKADQASARAIGTRGSSPWFPVSDKAREELRAWLGLTERTPNSAPPR